MKSCYPGINECSKVWQRSNLLWLTLRLTGNDRPDWHIKDTKNTRNCWCFQQKAQSSFFFHHHKLYPTLSTDHLVWIESHSLGEESFENNSLSVCCCFSGNTKGLTRPFICRFFKAERKAKKKAEPTWCFQSPFFSWGTVCDAFICLSLAPFSPS